MKLSVMDIADLRVSLQTRLTSDLDILRRRLDERAEKRSRPI